MWQSAIPLKIAPTALPVLLATATHLLKKPLDGHSILFSAFGVHPWWGITPNSDCFLHIPSMLDELHGLYPLSWGLYACVF